MARANDFEEVLEAIDMAGWLDSQGIDYRETRGARGLQLNVRECPMCGSSSWKVYLNADSGLGNCFAGDHPPGKNYTKFRFIQEALGLSGAEAAEHVRTYALAQGWRPPKVDSVPVSANTTWQMPASIALPHKGRLIHYLSNRGITPEMARYFHLRYAPIGAYFKYMGPQGPAFQDYGQRVLIPIFDLDGRLTTFQGRDITGTAARKYLFPPGISASGTQLYNGLNVTPGTRRVVVGEGAFDVIAIKMALDEDPDLRDVVPIGTFGKHLSAGDHDSQLEKFARLKRERGLEELTIMWDGEIVATDDAIEAGRLLKGLGLRVRIALLPFDKDPNEVPPSVVREAFYAAKLLEGKAEFEISMLRRRMVA